MCWCLYSAVVYETTEDLACIYELLEASKIGIMFEHAKPAPCTYIYCILMDMFISDCEFEILVHFYY
jgi:hypothetical protein